MTFGFLGGLANGYQGFQRGVDEEVARQRSAAAEARREAADAQLVKDQAYQQTQREYNQGQQARTLREQGNADGLRDDYKAVPAMRDIETTFTPTDPGFENEDGSVTPQAPVTGMRSIPRTNWQMSGDYALKAKARGFIEESNKHQAEYERGGSANAAKLFAELEASSVGMTPLQLVQAASKVYSDDPYAGKIDNIEQSTTDGTISFTVTNKATGESARKSFKDATQIMGNLRNYYSPEMQAKMQEGQRKAAIDANKPIVVAKDSTLMLPSGKIVGHGASSFAEDADGTPGSKGGKKGSNPGADLQKQVNDLVHKDNPNPAEVVSYAMELLRLKPDMVPATAARLAVGMQNGAKTRSAINTKTGLFDQVVDDFGTPDAKGKVANRGTGGTYLLSSSEYAPGGMVSKEEAAKAATAIMASTPENTAKGYLATQGQVGYDAYLKSLKESATKEKTAAVAAAAKATTPEERTKIVADYNDWENEMRNDGRRMELVRSHYTPPKATAAAAPVVNTPVPLGPTPSSLSYAQTAIDAGQKQKDDAARARSEALALTQKKDTADKADNLVRKGEARYITTEAARMMSPAEAKETLLRYSVFLDANTRSTLQRRTMSSGIGLGLPPLAR